MIGSPSYRQRRSGVILVVVVSLLALFAVVGLGYVIYAETAATASRLQRDSQVYVDDRATLEPELILNRVLGALIYDHPDDQSGVYSALRGHSLARNMYGQRGLVQVPDPTDPNPRPQNILINTDTVPFNGLGRMKYNIFEPSSLTFPGTTRRLSDLPWDQIINYTYYNRINPNERDPIVRHPEQYPFSPTGGPLQVNNFRTSLAAAAPYRYFGGYNAPYTYPDLNNVFLGAVRASDGQVLIPSFHRPYLFLDPTGNTDSTFLVNTTHPDWYKPSGRLKLLRPRPIDQVRLADPRQQQIWQANGNPPFPPQENISAAQLTQYSNATKALINAGLIMPYPTDPGGDVKNLLGAVGGNDSIWMDLGLPTRITKSGKKFKPLVSFLIVDLDGRINLNIHGNLRGQPGGTTAGIHLHASNQGIGRHEVNPMHVLNPNFTNEYQNLFQGAGGVPGRYSAGVAPYYPRPRIMIGTQQVDLSTYGASFLNPPNANDTVTASTYQIGATATQAASQLSTTISMPNPQYEPPYMRIDLDGANENLVMNRSRSESPYARPFNSLTLTQQPLLLSSFPDYYTSSVPSVMAGYGNESSFPILLNAMPTPQNDPTSELFQSASLFNPLRNTGNSRLLDALETHNMVARYNSPLDVQDSLLSKLLPQNLNATNALSAAIRHRITLVSADVGRAGLAPQTASWAATSSWTMPAGSRVPLAQQGEPFPNYANPAWMPLSLLDSESNDYSGTKLFAFAPGKLAPNYPNPGGSMVPVRVGSNLIATYDGRAGVASTAGRLDLNRPLPPYPPLNFTGTNITYIPSATMAQQIQIAENARIEFVREIFERLRVSVGAPPMNPPPTAGQPDYQALQYLAQLAVNIVDDIDEDDVTTVFHWNANATTPQATDWVYGVEMPKVVINEAYFEQTNGPTGDPQYVDTSSTPTKARNKYQINVWAELNHTMTPPFPYSAAAPDPRYFQFRDRHAAWLRNSPIDPLTLMASPTPTSVYRMYLIKDTMQVPTVGDAQAGTTPDINNVEKKVTFDTASKPALYPVDTKVPPTVPPPPMTPPHPCSYRCENSSVNDTGFYVIGPNVSNPQSPATTDLGSTPATLKSDQMSYDERLEDVVPNPMPPQIVLQRLANPYLPLQPNLGAPFYNPYITVDVMKATPPPTVAPTLTGVLNKQIQYNQTGNAPAGGTKKSVMRRQPFAGAYEHLAMSNMMQPGPDDHSMYRHNGRTDDAGSLTNPLQLPEPGGNGLERFDWFIHHDRKLVSPMELIHVAAVAPWEVTQSFIRMDPTVTPPNPNVKIRQGHTAPWFDKYEKYDAMNPSLPYNGDKVSLIQTPPPPAPPPTASTRLYRALEQFRVGDRTVEMAFGGRDLGKININTIWDEEVLRAICDSVAISQLDATRGFTALDVGYVWSALTDRTYNLSARTPFMNLSDPATGNLTPVTQTYGQITRFDQPFLGIGAPHVQDAFQYPPIPTGLPSPAQIQNTGVEATLFRSFVPNPSLAMSNLRYATLPKRKMVFDSESQFAFPATNPQPAVQHPLMEKALLSKIFEHLTTRSNVFAVYMTVGYFEVTNDVEKPELLGDEIGIIRDQQGLIVENKSIRHRMFAIVDRTNLSLQPPVFGATTNKFSGEDLQKQGPAPFYYTVPVALTPASGLSTSNWRIELPITTFQGAVNNPISVTGAYNGMSWQLKPFDVLYVGSGSEQRRLVIRQIQIVQNVAADGVTPILTASIQMAAPPATGTTWASMDSPPPHPVLITNVIAGNPGPQPDFDHRMPNYRGVVLYSVIMD